MLLRKFTREIVFSQALLMKTPHFHEGISDISLKIGRYKSPYKTLETLDPKSKLTLDKDELNSLIDYILNGTENSLMLLTPRFHY